VLENPEKLTNSARIGTIAALRFWDQHVSGEVDSLTVENVTKAINGGDNGLTQRKNQTEKASTPESCVIGVLPDLQFRQAGRSVE
jgi:predicted chitinase